MADNVWVFAYGSLIWNPGFKFRKFLIGNINGYSRRFYQGSDQHRGSSEMLGRVATLIEDQQGQTWGIAFLIEDEKTALEYLGQRESSIGGYTTIQTKFYPKNTNTNINIKTLDVLVYIALPENRLFLGPNSLKKIAEDIALAKGFCGYNLEYFAKLLAFMKIELPYIVDEHLIKLEIEIKKILQNTNKLELLKIFQDAIDSWLNSNHLFKNEDYYYDDDYENKSNQANDECFIISSLNSSVLSSSPSSSEEEEEEDKNYKFVDSLQQHRLRCMKKI